MLLPWFYSREAREAMMKMGFGPLYEEKPGSGGGGGGKKKDDDDDDGDEEAPKGGKKTGFREQARAMIARARDAEDVIVTLMREARDHRIERRALKEQIPGEGAVVLTGEDAALIAALGGPGKLKDALKERDDLKAFKSGREMKDLHEEAASTLGWDKDVLHDVAQARGLTVSVATEDVVVKDAAGGEDKKERRKVAKVKVGSGAPESLEDYFKRELKNYLPALTAAKAGDKKPDDFVPLPPQESGSSGQGGDRIGKFLEQQKKARETEKNPLQALSASTT